MTTSLLRTRRVDRSAWLSGPRSSGPGRAVALGLGAVLALGLVAGAARAAESGADPVAKREIGKVDECLDCHGDNADDRLELPDGAKLKVEVTKKMWDASVHAGEIGCTDCHTTISDYPHPDVEVKTEREFKVQQADTCKRCHYAQFTHVADSIHYRLLSEGKPGAPTCVDCHGAHDIGVPGQPRLSVDQRCAPCHAAISKAYRGSVHGKALVDSGDPDVPVCTDCHNAHRIKDPREADFHTSSYQICAKCHSDTERMERHSLNPNVVDTYLDDFHGASNALFAKGLGRPDKKLATCTDCHGVHDIVSLRTGDVAEVRARVLTTCKSCHTQVPDGFNDAWLGHYPATLESAPLVWIVKWFYRIVIPLMTLGLVLHILLHLWRLRFRRQGAHR